MLSESEQEIVRNHKEWGFGAYLQWAWIEYPDLQEEIGKGKYPEKERLRYANKRMNDRKLGFDFCYSHSLSRAETNPLKVETEAWELLSPVVGQYISEFWNYIEGYSPEAAEPWHLLAHVNYGWDLLQKWNTISNSYKAKYGTCLGPAEKEEWDNVLEREQNARELILELHSILA